MAIGYLSALPGPDEPFHLPFTCATSGRAAVLFRAQARVPHLRGSARRCYCLSDAPFGGGTGPMVSNKTKARLAVRGTVAVARHPALRRATMRVGAPTAKVVVKRQARERMERIGAAARTVGSIVVIYGPIAAEALGLVEAPKPKRRAPAFAAGAVCGVAASYVVLGQRR